MPTLPCRTPRPHKNRWPLAIVRSEVRAVAMKDAAVTSGVGSPRTLRLRRLTLHSQCNCGKLFLEAMQWPRTRFLLCPSQEGVAHPVPEPYSPDDP